IDVSKHNRSHNVIPEEYRYRCEHHSLRRCLADALSSESGIVTLVTANPGDQGSEAQGLINASEDVHHVHVIGHLSEISAFADTQKTPPYQIASKDTDHIEHGCEQWEDNDPCKKFWHDEIPNRVDAHQLNGIDLFGDSHDPDFSRHRGTGPARDH